MLTKMKRILLMFVCYVIGAGAVKKIEVKPITSELTLPRYKVSWNESSEDSSSSLFLVIKKTRGITGGGTENEVLVDDAANQNEMTVTNLEFDAEYNFTLVTKRNDSIAQKSETKSIKTMDAPCAIPISGSQVELLVVYHENAIFYEIFTHKVENTSVSNATDLPATNSIHNNGVIFYASVCMKTVAKNGSRIIVGNGKNACSNKTIGNVPLQQQSRYSFFQRTSLKNGKKISYKWMPIITTLSSTTTVKEADDDLKSDEIAIMTVGIAIGLIAVIFCIICCCHYKFTMKYAPKPGKKHGRTQQMQRLNTDPSIPVTDTDFYDHMAQMKFHNFKGFYEEFSQMTIDFQPSEDFRHPDNVIKNRFVNIPCYDHTRVKLNVQDQVESYIHANFVPGADTDEDYIITQSPLTETVEDFWRMVWQQNVSTIVMVGELFEKGNQVCARYFPDKDNRHIKAFGEISLVKEYAVSDYAVRVLSISLDEEIYRTVYHFQFLSWPSVQITPPCSTSFLDFVQAILKTREKLNNNLTVVHGTTGSGRSGIYACVDAQIRRVKKQNDINVYNSIQTLRECRHDAIKTLDEYIFIHEAILEFILKRNIHNIPVQYLPTYIENNTKSSIEEPFGVEYKFLSSTVISSTQKMTAANHPYNQKKNRYETVKPFDDNRVKLTKLVNAEGSDYINASYIDTYLHKKSFIATQAPLVDTLGDFWRMVFECESWVILMLGQEIENGQLKADRFWPEEGYVLALDYLSVKLISASHDVIKDVIVRQIEIMHTKTSETKFVQMYQYLTWPSHEGITSESIYSLVQLVHQSTMWKEKLHAKCITVVSSSGIGRSGVLIALRSLQEESETEGTLNVFRTVQRLREQRAALIQKREEYVLIYTSTLEITKHVRRRSIVTASIDVNNLGLDILPNGYGLTPSGAIYERFNSISQTSVL